MKISNLQPSTFQPSNLQPSTFNLQPSTFQPSTSGEQSGWWVIGLFIPFVNFAAAIVTIIAFVNIFKKLGKSPWMILLFLIPLVNFWLMYHLAFS